MAAQADPRIVLDGDPPRLIDEYQLVDGLWEAVRGRIDHLGRPGLFLLTGSATPDDGVQLHTGARRIAPVRMRTMTLQERGLSSGKVSLGELLRGEPVSPVSDCISVSEAMEAVVVGGWPDNLGLTPRQAIESNLDYVDIIVNRDLPRVGGVKRDPDGVRRLIRSYARNVGTDASLRTVARTSDRPLSDRTLYDYLSLLRRLYLVEDQDAWKPNLRSRIRLAATPKRHLADPSLAAAVLSASIDRLVGPEMELAGLLFESQVIHDLRVYAEPHRGTVWFYRDNKGLEVDAIVETQDGRWAAFEVKLGPARIDAGAQNLITLRGKLMAEEAARCGALVVVSANTPSYLRSDGVQVTSLAALGP
jgi:predicted AAA+ superfamily ATPase